MGAIFAAILLLDIPAYLRKDHEYLAKLPGWLWAAIMVIGATAVAYIMIDQGGDRPFYYFQF